ncbi:putative extracellular serine-rich [Phaeomoniella chlamydospora]|uniref:Putative extracellular serine-rich n=1 Tax=Phaeomoniella chlamydospora TaxID=158046 RepID=A0A0G2GG92_PHACM|nr:putative extracellular serine-rich [Phaeomoniella chlamydospora]
MNVADGSTALIVGTTNDDGSDSTYILDGYGIHYEKAILTKKGDQLPALETAGGGNYGLLIMVASVPFLEDSQWSSLYEYQEKYGVRMIQLNVYPSSDFGVELYKACNNATDMQELNIVSEVAQAEFPTAGLRQTNLSTEGLFHCPANILSENASTTTAFLQFQPTDYYPNVSVAGVINRLDTGREQMAMFMSSGNWSTTATYCNHIWVQWGYRGLYQGRRRLFLGTQVDDLFLTTTIYNSSEGFRVRPADLEAHINFTQQINERLNVSNPGSDYFTEFGFNANGNIAFEFGIWESNVSTYSCAGPLFTSWEEPSTGLEYKKPLGTGTSSWPKHPTFDWTAECVFLDPLARFFVNETNRDSFGLVSHTFTHLNLDLATYHDVLREISYNLLFAELMNFTNAMKFSGSGLIPPAITGMHNGDALRAFSDNGLWNAIGDNTRPVLRNPQNFHWPRMTDMEINGFSGYQITPRFSTRIYYNCDNMECDVDQCVTTADCKKAQGMEGLLTIERKFQPNYMIGLFHDPYMFHQPNLRQTDVEEFSLGSETGKFSLLAMWVHTIVDELVRLVDWPIVSLKHDHIAMEFNNRMTSDACSPWIQYHTSKLSNGSMAITSVTVRARGGKITGSSGGVVSITTDPKYNNTCAVPIPVTIPYNITISATGTTNTTDTTLLVNEMVDRGLGYRVESIGNDPPTIWVRLDGDPVTFNFDGEGVLL